MSKLVIEAIAGADVHRNDAGIGSDIVDGILDGLEIRRETDLRWLVVPRGRIQHRLEDVNAVLHVRAPDDLLVGRVVVQFWREERSVNTQCQQRRSNPERILEIFGEVGRVRHLIVGLNRRDETLWHHRLGSQ